MRFKRKEDNDAYFGNIIKSLDFNHSEAQISAHSNPKACAGDSTRWSDKSLGVRRGVSRFQELHIWQHQP
jgi:hypothetical protein